MKVMLSQPMNGRTEEEIRTEREKIIQKFKDLDIEVEDTLFKVEPLDIKNLGVWYLAKSIEKLANVNALYMCQGWGTARGCQIERKIALDYGIKVLNTDFLENEGESIFR